MKMMIWCGSWRGGSDQASENGSEFANLVSWTGSDLGQRPYRNGLDYRIRV
ncbi:hypothetical protein L195_g049970 [Trifolium pratense]|uniref:Uncharacterized protein n=1 Tax=Trifolium pratense TaxID=57577 RepID=A0A2K3JRE5_TRIPR|nr:hypothetical protein L195_g049970 [Trifolium pratense]